MKKYNIYIKNHTYKNKTFTDLALIIFRYKQIILEEITSDFAYITPETIITDCKDLKQGSGFWYNNNTGRMVISIACI